MSKKTNESHENMKDVIGDGGTKKANIGFRIARGQRRRDAVKTNEDLVIEEETDLLDIVTPEDTIYTIEEKADSVVDKKAWWKKK